jgi:membrane fusion protein, multidrug efflux system
MSTLRSTSSSAASRLAQYLPLATGTIGLTTLLLLAGCGRDAAARPAAADSAIPVRVTTLGTTAGGAPGALTVSGTLAGKEEVPLAFKVGGVIARITVDPGQSVRAGQVLAALQSTEISAQVASAVEARRKAERDLERVTRLYTDSVATLEQLQDARTGLEVARNAAVAAQFNADYAVIRAPGDGIVLARAAEPGQVIEPGRPVVTVRRSGRGMIVRLGLPDHDAVRIRLGDSAAVTFEALPGRQFVGVVTQRAAVATQGTGDYAIEVALNDADALPSGLVARVTLRPHDRRTASTPVLVPLDALVDADADSAAVFVLAPDRARVSRRPIRLTDVAEALQSAQVPVTSGLTGSETVVTAGASRLLDGTRVRVITTPGQRAAADAAPRATVLP